MKILSSPLLDKKLNAYNVIVELTLEKYYNLVRDVIDKNQYQRNRIRSSKSIYSLLQNDLNNGCLMPPIVLALNKKIDNELLFNLDLLKNTIINDKEYLFILDGLQRTFTIKDVLKSEDLFSSVKDNLMRVEIYLNISKEGILYRMLTLNTGQTPMSLRHQIEMIYFDLQGKHENFSLYPDTEENMLKEIGNYRFSDSIDAFTSFMEQDYLQITRDKLLTTIKSFEKLSNIKNERDAFTSLINSYTIFQKKIEECIASVSLEEQVNFKPFGVNAYQIFSKSQPMTGYGASVARLLELEVYEDIDSISKELTNSSMFDIEDGIVRLLEILNDLKSRSKKIGNSQRCLFYFFFKNLLDKESVCFLNVLTSIEKALIQHDRDI